MLRLFVTVLLILPFAEIVMLVQVGHYLGFWLTLALLVLAAVAGINLLRWQNARALQRLSTPEMTAATGSDLLAGLLLSLAGVLLVIPGFITDGLALVLLLPWVRKPLAHWLLARGMAATVAGMGPGLRFSNFEGWWSSNQPPADANIYEGEFTRESPPNNKLLPPDAATMEAIRKTQQPDDPPEKKS